ncbi:MAG: hypothetical protein H7263_14120 [Candidatus Sericytochromatia bacterium]|nr:hypothetical protein [Candidatus Sericytochromatia bacterium]
MEKMNLKKASISILILLSLFSNQVLAKENIINDVNKNVAVKTNIIFLKNKNETKSSKVLKDSVTKILAGVKTIRSLSNNKPVIVGVKTKEELNLFLNKLINKEYSVVDATSDKLLLERLGLLKKGSNLKNIFINLYTQQIAGLYDNDAKELYIIENPEMGDLEFSIVISHELTHALQDQNFDIHKFLDSSHSNSDMSLARSAVIEGEAMFASSLYVIKDVQTVGIKGLGALLNNPLGASLAAQNSLKDVPGFLLEQMTFPYIKGNEFVTTLYKLKGGWTGFNSIYQYPPKSTSQIIHPEKYLTKQEPIKVLLDEKIINDKGWKFIKKDTFGEFFLQNYFLEYVDSQLANEASAGWAGDTSSLYQKENSDNSILIYKSVWDTTKDAEQFFSAYVKTINARYEKLIKNKKSTLTSYSADTPDGKIYLKLGNKSVNIAEGFSTEMSKKLTSYLNK